MKGPNVRRQAVLESVADHVLRVGLQGTSLRPLASAIGTSDRMLLYYFSDKDELMTETIQLIAGRLLALLEAERIVPEVYPVLLQRIYELLIRADIRPFMQVWLELVARAARNEEPFRTITAGIADGFLGWVSGLLKVEREEDRPAQAALLLSTVEGLVLLESVGRGNITNDAVSGLLD
jgi:AcrR family transcriptional regulator